MYLLKLTMLLAFLAIAAGKHIPAALADDLAAQSTRDRVIVRGEDYPWRAIGRVQWAGVANRAHCSGALIGRKLVITAAHCLYDLSHKIWINPSQVHFLAGFDRGEFLDHSNAEKILVSPNFIAEDWDAITNLPYDWALIYLAKPIGDNVGYLGWQSFDNSYSLTSLNKKQLTLAGYPWDRQYVLSLEKDCKIDEFDQSGNMFKHNCRLAHGDSGGPFTIMEEGRLSVIGLNNAVTGELGNTQSTAIALGPIASFIKHFLTEDGTLNSKQPTPLIFGWAPDEK